MSDAMESLYPFLYSDTSDLSAVLDQVRASTVAKAADHVLVTPSDDPRVVKELQVTAYHVLWELVHVFFEQPGLLEDRPEGER